MGNNFFGEVNSIPNNPLNPQSQPAQPNGPYGAEAGGVRVTYNQMHERMDFQIHTIKVTEANKRYDFDLLAKITNERILGFFMTSTEVVDNELKSNLNHSTVQLTIDNEEIIPNDTDASLFSSKINAGFYENIYPCNEKANGSQIKGAYISGGESTFKGPYEVKLYFWSSKKKK